MSQTATRAIPLVDLHAQYRELRSAIDAAISGVVTRAQFIQGPDVVAFENEFNDFLGSTGVVGVASGTAALHLALTACKVGTGDEVITTPLTFIATAEAISHTGATPVFADVDRETLNLDPNKVEDAITPRTRAIVPVHLYGRPAAMDELAEIAERRGLWLIEDAAQAHGATYRGKACGTIGHLAAFSFYPGKNLGAFGDAGAVTGGDAELLGTVRKLRDHGRTSKYLHDEVGFGERLDTLQAAVLRVKLARLGDWNAARTKVAETYRDQLSDSALKLPLEDPSVGHANHLYVVRTDRRDEVLAALNGAGIGAGVHYPIPLHRQPAYRELEAGPFPEAELAAAEVLSLPMHPHLTEDDIAFVVANVRQTLG